MPYLLCAGAVAAAALAAYVGHLMSPSVRTRRAQRRRWDQLRAIRFGIAGHLAKDPAAWDRWWDERTALGMDDELDVLRGGA